MRKLLLPVFLFALLSIPSVALGKGPTFRGNAAHTGVYEDPGVPQFHKVKWQFQTKGQILSSPALTSDTVYIGSSDHFLYAVNLSDGNAYAVDASTGSQKWKFALPGERRFAATHLHGATPVGETMPDPFDFYLSSPNVVDGIVYFGSGDTNVYALDAANGQLKWKFKTGDVVHASPAIADGKLYVGSWDSYFYALDAKTGDEIWRFKTGEDPDIHNQVGIQSSAAVADGVVYFGCRDSNFYALDAATGKERWRFNNKGSWVIGSPAVANGKVYFGTSDTALFYALDAKSGAQLFSRAFHSWPLFSSPALAGDRVYLGSHEGKLFAIDLKSQKLAWTFATDGSKKNGATYTKPDGTPNYDVAFTDFFYDDMIFGVQKMMTVGAVLSSPVIAGDTVYFGSADGNLYALN
jgi:outer membrane protein assembly factor BamB